MRGNFYDYGLEDDDGDYDDATDDNFSREELMNSK